MLGAKANSNDRGLIINGILDLSPESATIFYWVLCGLSVGFVVLSAVLSVMRLSGKQRIVLSDHALTVPKSRWSSQALQIEFGEIRDVQLAEVYGQRFAYVFHPGGKATITASMLPQDGDFDEIVRALTKARVP